MHTTTVLVQPYDLEDKASARRSLKTQPVTSTAAEVPNHKTLESLVSVESCIQDSAWSRHADCQLQLDSPRSPRRRIAAGVLYTRDSTCISSLVSTSDLETPLAIKLYDAFSRPSDERPGGARHSTHLIEDRRNAWLLPRSAGDWATGCKPIESRTRIVHYISSTAAVAAQHAGLPRLA
jgi:hypothetical protein